MKGPVNAFGMYAQIIGVYDSGLIAPVTNSEKPAVPVASAGQELDFGLIASHRWRRGEFSVNYRGSYRQYTNAPAFSGLDQFLQLDYREVLARHLALNINTTLGTTTLANGAFSYFPAASIESVGIPTDELFNSRTNYLQSRVELTWLLSPRLSLSFGGDGFVVRRESPLLAGLNGYNARTSVAYRLTARQTISASYDHMYFDFEQAFGNSRLESAALGYSIVLTRQWELASLFGGVRVNTLGLTRVPLDPAVVALLGQSFAVVTFSEAHYLPVMEARLTRRFKQASLLFDYSNSITPGNGFYLTSRQTAAGITYSYVATRALEARVGAGYNQFSALGETLGQVTGKYSNLQSGFQLLYSLTGDISLNVRYDYRHYTTGDVFLRLDSSRVSAGIEFNFGEMSSPAR